MRVRTKLTIDQIERAKALRFKDKWAWSRIAAQFECDGETVHRAIDPDYAHQRYTATVSARLRRDVQYADRFTQSLRNDAELAEEQSQTQRIENICEQDARFQAAMRTAILRKEEICSEGVCKTPSTERPVFVALPGQPSSGMRSPAALCAEIA